MEEGERSDLVICDECNGIGRLESAVAPGDVCPTCNGSGRADPPMLRTCCFTGHRPEVFGGYDETLPMVTRTKAWLSMAVEVLLKQGHEYFISGAALGVDQWAAKIVLVTPGAKLIVALPFKDYGGNWPASSRMELQDICDAAHAVEVVCDGGYEAWKNHERNKYMVDRSRTVVAVWNGSGDGGTASCVRYAFSKKKPIYRYEPCSTCELPVNEVPKRTKK